MDIRSESHGELNSVFHFLFEQGAHALFFVLRRFDYQLIVHLHNKLRRQILAFKAFVNSYHRYLDYIRRRALGILRATRSPNARVLAFDAVSSGRYLRRANIVSA